MDLAVDLWGASIAFNVSEDLVGVTIVLGFILLLLHRALSYMSE